MKKMTETERKEAKKVSRKKYNDANKVSIAAKSKKYSEANKVAITDRKKRRYKENSDALKAYQANYRKENKEAIDEYQKGYARNNQRGFKMFSVRLPSELLEYIKSKGNASDCLRALIEQDMATNTINNKD